MEHLDNAAVERINRQPNMMSRFPGPGMQACGTDGMAWQGDSKFPLERTIGEAGLKPPIAQPLFMRVLPLGFAIEIVLNGCCVFESGGVTIQCQSGFKVPCRRA